MALTDNLIRYWKLDESSGNAADSVTPASGTLTNNGSTPYVTGKINNGIDFESSGSNQFLKSGTSILGISGNVAWSWSGWFNFESLPSSGNTITLFAYNETAVGTSGAAINCFILNDSGTYKFRADNLGTATNGTANLGITTGTWYHIVVTYTVSGTAWKIYINNSLIDTVTHSGNNTDADANNVVTLGSSWYYALAAGSEDYAHTDGIVDEVGFWSRVITTDEIAELYNSGNGLQYPFTTTAIKTINGLASASVKTVNGLAIASVKTKNGLA